MAEDQRKGRSTVQDYAEIAGGDGNPHTVFPLREEDTVSASFVKIEYADSATVADVLTLYDETDGTSSGDLSDDVDKFLLSPGDRIIIEDATYEDLNNGLIVQTGGASDGEIVVTVGGVKITG